MKTTVIELSKAAEHFRGLREEVERATSTINPVEMVTPKDIQGIKQEWIEKAKTGLFTDPVFHYSEEYLERILQARDTLEALLDKLAKTGAEGTAELFHIFYLEEVVRDCLLTVKMARAILRRNHSTLTKAVLEKYGEADADLVQYAESLANTGFTRDTGIELNEDLKRLSEVKFNAFFIKEMFTWAMERYEETYPHITPWPVEVRDDCSAIDVRDKSSCGYPVIVIPRSREVTLIKLAELIGHEIECHWRNSQNASILGLPKIDDETVYEGAAKLKDYRFNERYSTKVSTPIPYYILAQQFARSGGSFAETASYLTDTYGLAPEKSWTYTYRTFRGSSDMSNAAKYAFTKDRAYLEGFYFAQHADKALLNLGTLGKKQLKSLALILDLEEIETHTIPDLDIQSDLIQRIPRLI